MPWRCVRALRGCVGLEVFASFGGRATVLGLLMLTLVTLTGCGGGEAAKKMAVAQVAVQSALEAWRSGQTLAAFKSANPSVSFFDDDWQRGAALQQFQLVKTYVESDGTARCAVELNVRQPNGSAEQRKLTYQVVPKDQQLVIAIDPFS